MVYEKQTGSAVIERLFETIESRRKGQASDSYVASLFQAGTSEIVKKVGEEAVETTIAALNGDKEMVVRESADLLFHLIILWTNSGVTPNDIFSELIRREGISGITEKKSRAQRMPRRS